MRSLAAALENRSDRVAAYCGAVWTSVESETPGEVEPPGFYSKVRYVEHRTESETLYLLSFGKQRGLRLLAAPPSMGRIGIGPSCSTIDGVWSSIERAREALTGALFYPEERAFHSTPVNHEAIRGIAALLSQTIMSGEVAAVQRFFDELPSLMRQRRLMPWDARVLRDVVMNNGSVGAVDDAVAEDGSFASPYTGTIVILKPMSDASSRSTISRSGSSYSRSSCRPAGPSPRRRSGRSGSGRD